VNQDGSGDKQLTFSSNDSYPTWSPTGEYLAYTSKVGDNWEIFLLNLTDNDIQQLTDRPATDITPVFGPNGREIYLRTDHRGGGVHWRLTAINIETGQERTVKEGVGPSTDWGLARPAVR
jgi:Tol biopolymer transport system component